MSLHRIRHRPRSYPRGEDTRRRILETAIELFAAEGYVGAKTRSLAERAGVTLAAIQYYFGSKEGLYRAAIGHIVRQIEERLAGAAERAAATLARRGPSRKELLERLYGILDAFAALVTGSNNPESWAMFITRAEIEKSAALGPLHECMVRQVVRPCAALIGNLLHRSPEDEEILLRTLTILGQIMIFHRKCGNKGVAQLLGFDSFDGERMRIVQALVRRQTAAILRNASDARP